MTDATLAIFAGRGNLPVQIITHCKETHRSYIIMAFEGQTPPELVANEPHEWVRFGGVSKLFKALRKHNVKEIVMAGAMTRPSLLEVKPDFKALSIGVKSFLRQGDDGLLQSLIRILEDQEGFIVVSPSDLIDLKAKGKLYTKKKPSEDSWHDIKLGFHVAQAIGALDVGQGCVVQQGIVLALEAVEGTQKMLERVKDLKLAKKGGGGVLVKVIKPQQDTRVDMPSIGSKTILQAHEAGCVGVAIHADNTLMIDEAEIIKIANKYKMFVIGINTKIISENIIE